jgi:cell division protein FtsL
MNVAVKTLNQITVLPRLFAWTLVFKEHAIITLLTLTLLFSAFGIICVKDVNRRLVGDLQIQQTTNDNLRNRWSQLLLEESAWSSQTRVEQIARQQLGMIVPKVRVITV